MKKKSVEFLFWNFPQELQGHSEDNYKCEMIDFLRVAFDPKKEEIVRERLKKKKKKEE